MPAIAGPATALPPPGTFGSLTAATPGGTQAAAAALLYDHTTVLAVATAADSVSLGLSVPGASKLVVNGGAASMQVFGLGADTINGVAAATGVAQAAGVGALYFCYAAGKWMRFLQG